MMIIIWIIICFLYLWAGIKLGWYLKGLLHGVKT